MGSCVAFNCTNRTTKKIPGITFHRFPKDDAKRASWILAIRRQDWRPSRLSTICSAHFPEHMIDRTSLSVVRLREGAVPSIFDFSTRKKKKKSSGTTSKEEDKRTDHIPLEPAIEIKEEPVDYEPTPSTSTEAANEEFILPHEESTWTPPNPAVEPQFTLSVASLACHNNPETSDSEQQVGKKRKIKSSTFVPSTNGSEVRPESPVYNFGDSSNPGSLKEPRKDQFDVFGEYIAAKLRSLDKRSRAYAQKAIGDIIFEAEMGKYLDEDSDSKVLNNSAS